VIDKLYHSLLLEPCPGDKNKDSVIHRIEMRNVMQNMCLAVKWREPVGIDLWCSTVLRFETRIFVIAGGQSPYSC
jgi:hypothetical protein